MQGRWTKETKRKHNRQKYSVITEETETTGMLFDRPVLEVWISICPMWTTHRTVYQ